MLEGLKRKSRREAVFFRGKQPESSLLAPKYRPDIDGLRAIAVLSVVAFHAFPGFAPGGFIGVDVFFVISGFLISTIIFSNVEQAKFSVLEFYQRRIRRIFPALIVVLLATMAAGWLFFLADEFAQLGKHVAGGATFVSNFLLWRESGYFDTLAERKPLLHLWSLGIEEQFYVFWPLLVAGLWVRRANLLATTLLVALASFGVSIWLVGSEAVAAFYSPFARFWELMTGSFLAYACIHYPVWRDKESSARSVLGLLLLAAGLLLISRDRNFPGWWAVLPTLGAFFVISAGNRAWFNRHFLSSRPLVTVGLISYPLYLWHWPLLSFARTIRGEELSRTDKLGLIAIAVMLSWVTYRVIETPLRFGQAGQAKAVALLICMFGVGCTGGIALLADGFPARDANGTVHQKARDLFFLPKASEYVECPIRAPWAASGLSFCKQSKTGEAKFALFGDSHAEDKFYGLTQIDKEDNWLTLASYSCPPLDGIDMRTPWQNCSATEKATQWLQDNRSIETVVLTFLGSYFLTSDVAADHLQYHNGPSAFRIFELDGRESRDRKEAFFRGLDSTIQRLTASGKRVVLLIDIPELPFFPRDCLAGRIANGCSLATADAMRRQAELRSGIGALTQKYGRLLVFDPLKFLCAGPTCAYETPDILIYKDSHHLSARGSVFYASYFIPWLKLSLTH